MKIHWSIADQELQFGVEHTGKRVMFEKISVPFLSIEYFMWGHEDKETITKRVKWIGSRLKTLIFG
jgi:hypothetical protein